MRYRIALSICLASAWVATFMVIIFAGILATGRYVIFIEHITPIAVFELIMFASLAVLSIICAKKLWNSTGKDGGRCVLCNSKLKRSRQ